MQQKLFTNLIVGYCKRCRSAHIAVGLKPILRTAVCGIIEQAGYICQGSLEEVKPSGPSRETVVQLLKLCLEMIK